MVLRLLIIPIALAAAAAVGGVDDVEAKPRCVAAGDVVVRQSRLAVVTRRPRKSGLPAYFGCLRAHGSPMAA